MIVYCESGDQYDWTNWVSFGIFCGEIYELVWEDHGGIMGDSWGDCARVDVSIDNVSS